MPNNNYVLLINALVLQIKGLVGYDHGPPLIGFRVDVFDELIFKFCLTCYVPRWQCRDVTRLF